MTRHVQYYVPYNIIKIAVSCEKTPLVLAPRDILCILLLCYYYFRKYKQTCLSEMHPPLVGGVNER